MTAESYSRYTVTWMCNECGEKWAAPDKPDEPCTATEGCKGEPMGIAFWDGTETAEEAAHKAVPYMIVDDAGTKTYYNADGTVRGEH